jgi:hypothetical protein
MNNIVPQINWKWDLIPMVLRIDDVVVFTEDVGMPMKK